MGRNEGAGDAELFFLTQQVVRVTQLEGEAEYGGDGSQGNVALVPGQAHAEHLFPFPLAFADDAEVGNRARIRTRFRAGQGRNRGSPCRQPDGAGSNPSARQCRSVAAIHPALRSWARRR